MTCPSCGARNRRNRYHEFLTEVTDFRLHRAMIMALRMLGIKFDVNVYLEEGGKYLYSYYVDEIQNVNIEALADFLLDKRYVEIDMTGRCHHCLSQLPEHDCLKAGKFRRSKALGRATTVVCEICDKVVEPVPGYVHWCNFEDSDLDIASLLECAAKVTNMDYKTGPGTRGYKVALYKRHGEHKEVMKFWKVFDTLKDIMST